jgi:hypothetical protein
MRCRYVAGIQRSFGLEGAEAEQIQNHNIRSINPRSDHVNEHTLEIKVSGQALRLILPSMFLSPDLQSLIRRCSLMRSLSTRCTTSNHVPGGMYTWEVVACFRWLRFNDRPRVVRTFTTRCFLPSSCPAPRPALPCLFNILSNARWFPIDRLRAPTFSTPQRARFD